MHVFEQVCGCNEHRLHTLCLLIFTFTWHLLVFTTTNVSRAHTHSLIGGGACGNSESCGQVEVKAPPGSWALCGHTSTNYFIKSDCSCACVFTHPAPPYPPGCDDGSRRLLFHCLQVRTYSSQEPAKPGDTLTVAASPRRGRPFPRLQTETVFQGNLWTKRSSSTEMFETATALSSV